MALEREWEDRQDASSDASPARSLLGLVAFDAAAFAAAAWLCASVPESLDPSQAEPRAGRVEAAAVSCR